MRLNPGEAWTRCQRGGIAINNGESVAKDEFRSSDAGVYDHLEKHIHQ